MFNVPVDMKLSKDFSLQEFQCHDGSKTIQVNYKLVNGLQLLRDTIGKAIQISSGYRTQEYNKSCGGIDNSEHLTGSAADIKIVGMTPMQVAKAADKLKLFSGIGVYDTFTHVDVGHFKGYWKQDNSGKKTFYKSLSDIK